MKKIIFSCDLCKKEFETNKEFVILAGQSAKFTAEGIKLISFENHYCAECSGKIMRAIEGLNQEQK